MANEQGPAKGQTEQINKPAGTSAVVKNAREAVGSTAIHGSTPGSGQLESPSDGIVLEGLGNLSEAPKEILADDDPNGGTGDYLVVLHSFVSGVDRIYTKGKVRRASNFIKGFGDPEQLDTARQEAKRLFDHNAVRVAARDEQGKDTVVLDIESDALRIERAKRIAAEKELDKLKAKSLDRNVAAGAEENWQ